MYVSVSKISSAESLSMTSSAIGLEISVDVHRSTYRERTIAYREIMLHHRPLIEPLPALLALQASLVIDLEQSGTI